MDYTVEDLKNVLANIKNNANGIVYIEHFVSKIEKRNILDSSIEDKLQFTIPITIKKVPDYLDRFELLFPFDGSNNLVVVVDIFLISSLVLITAFLTEKIGCAR